MKTKLLMLFIVTILFYIEAGAQNTGEKFRVVGYVMGNLDELGASIDFSRITHLNIAFINPDSAGVFKDVPGLKTVVTKAHKNGVKVLMAIAGGRAPAYYRTLVSPARRTLFIANISKFMKDNQLDGVDVDIEGELITNDYEGFVKELALAIKPGKLVTAAVATEYGNHLSDIALAQFDFINIMSYDKTGPWQPQDPGQHAPYVMAVSDLDYWKIERKIDGTRLNLGVPFYGYSFGLSGAGSQTYKGIIEKNADAKENDELPTADGGMIFYNGVSTIKMKTRLALERTGGIMIWQLFQDATDANSLLRLINNEIRALDSKK